MSLETVLRIGHALRQSEDSLKHFKYVERCPQDNKTKEYPFCLSIPLNEDITPNWEKCHITHENQRDQLYYLKFKTSDSDGMVKYVFGDIYYSQDSKIDNKGIITASEGGYYRLPNPNHSNAAYRMDSFQRGEADFQDMVKSAEEKSLIVSKFRERFRENIDVINNILSNIPAIEHYFETPQDISFEIFIKNKPLLEDFKIRQNFQKINSATLKKMKVLSKYFEELSDDEKTKLSSYSKKDIFIHFEFPNTKQWYQYDEDMSLLNKKILSDFVDNTEHGFVMKKTLYKTLCSGDSKNDIQFPGFQFNSKHKSKAFSEEELQDLFYAISYSGEGRMLSNTDIKMITLPRGENLTAEDFENFQDKKDEQKIVSSNQMNGDPMFASSDDKNNKITAFDFVFCKKGGLTSPDKDLIEISGIEKSKLKEIRTRIELISREITEERKNYLRTDKNLFPLDVGYSFRSILGNPKADFSTGKVSFDVSPQYQSHLLKIIPLIYTENYCTDGKLIPAFIQNVEYSIRAGDEKYGFLKFDLKFLLKIQNTQNNKYMEIKDSKNYQIGYKLGRLSRPLKNKINSFEKNYVGLLTRRVGSYDDCLSFFNEINQKLIMHHDRSWWGATSSEISETLSNLPRNKYNKEEVAFGFFEGYFTYEAPDNKEKFLTSMEKFLSNYVGKENLATVVDQFTMLLNEAKE